MTDSNSAPEGMLRAQARAAGAPVGNRSSTVVAMVTDGFAELHTHLGGSVASDIMWSLAHEQGIALPTRLLGVRPHGHGVGSPRRARSRLARSHLPPDGTDPVVTARRRAQRACRDRRRVPVAAHHDARAALQPDEAQPRR